MTFTYLISFGLFPNVLLNASFFWGFYGEEILLKIIMKYVFVVKERVVNTCISVSVYSHFVLHDK